MWYILGYVCGIVEQDIRMISLASKQKIFLTSLFLLLSVAIGYFNPGVSMWSNSYGKNYLLFMLGGIIGSIWLGFVCKWFVTRNIFLQFLGQNTITILAAHEPIKRSEIHINVAEDDEFAFTDLAGMYDASLMIPKKGAKSSIEIYYENEEKLAKYVMNVIENVNFEFYPELLDTLTEFYRIYIKSDEKEIVLWPLTVDDLDNRKLIITAMTNMIKSKDNDWVAQNAKGKLNGNVMKSYVTLYLKAREERKLIAKYTQEINKVKLQNGQS